MTETQTQGYEQIEFEVTESVARITLNRPDSLNPLSIRMATEAKQAIDTVAADDGIRALLIRGAGRGFSSGADLGGSDLSGGDRPMTDDGKPDVLTGLRESYNPLILAVRELPKPVVAAVRGPVAGVGCSLALACDQVLAAESAYMLMAFGRIGLTLDGGASAFLTARAGAGRAAQMAMLAEKVPAEQALGWGLVDRVHAEDELDEEAEGLVARLAAGPTLSYAASKQLLNESAYGGLESLAAQLDREAVAQQKLAESEDFPIGVMGFLAKQKPEFKGR